MSLSFISSIEILISGIVVVIGIILGEKLPRKVANRFQARMASLTPLEQEIFLEGRRKIIRTWEIFFMAAIPVAWIFTAGSLSNPDSNNMLLTVCILAIPLTVTTLWYIMTRTRKVYDNQILETNQKQPNNKFPEMGASREQPID